jgi:hypothetical protein
MSLKDFEINFYLLNYIENLDNLWCHLIKYLNLVKNFYLKWMPFCFYQMLKSFLNNLKQGQLKDGKKIINNL